MTSLFTRLIPLRKFRHRVAGPFPSLFNVLRHEIDDGAGVDPFRQSPFAYLGEVSEQGFEIRRINAYRSTFMPHIKARFTPETESTVVDITMRPHREVFIFSFIWYAFLILCSLLIILSAAGGHVYRIFFLALPLGLGVSSWLLTILVFESDCRWARKSLEDNLFSKRPHP